MLKTTIKKTIAVLLAICMLTLICTIGAYAAEPTETNTPEHKDLIFGDVNGDAKLTVADATELQRYSASYPIENPDKIYTNDGNPMSTEEYINYVCDLDNNGKVNIQDATIVQMYVAEFYNLINEKYPKTKTSTVALKWQDAEYEDVYPTKTITVTDKEDYDETVEAPVHQTGVETRCIYKVDGATTICNDCDMPLMHDDGTTFSSAEIGNHISAHRFGLVPCTTHKDRLVWIDPNWYHWDICEYDTAEKPVDISYTEPRTGEKVSFTLSYDEAVKRLGDKPAHTWVTDEDYMEWGRGLDYYRMGWTDTYPEKDRCFILNGGNYGSWRNNYPSKLQPSGQMETIPINDYVPEYRSGYAWVCRRCGKVAYFEDGKEYDQRDRERHTVGTVNYVSTNYRDPDFLAKYTCTENPQTCPNLLENEKYPVPNWYPETLGGFDWVWTDKIPTGRFTDVPKATTTVTVHHDAVTHTEEVTDYDAEPIDKKLIKPEGYYAVQ